MVLRSKILSLFLFLLLVMGCDDKEPNGPPYGDLDLTQSFYYEINLKDRSDDTFKVTLHVDNLTEANAVFQFPATVPGTYDIFDIGRFITTFKAFDEDHHELAVSAGAMNQWILSDPENTRSIEFEVNETFDTPVFEHAIYAMAGTSIENDHTLLNTFDVLGYPTGLKERDFYLNIKYPSTWSVGTSLQKTDDGLYYATNYDQLVDSPLLLGKVTKASTTVDNSEINIVTYSKTNQITSTQILNDVEQVLIDASAFLKGLPVDRYNFLYFFEERNAGALEHSYSSVYVLTETPYSIAYGQYLRNISAHEFFHIVTPLNIHSEIIEDFNFAEPTASEHLWLYEGVTEWASVMMQYRNSSISVNTVFNRFRSKKLSADNYDLNYSLSSMSLNCYTPEGGAQFGNVYNKGALVAALLDIRLLELSNGEKGLRELILELIDTYGPENAFSETSFFGDLTEMTYPEIEDFINRYIKGTDALPLAEYFAKIGVNYDAASSTFSLLATPTPEQQALFAKWKVNM